MAFDGITVACLRLEIENRILGGRITRIAQTESDEIILTIKPLMERGGGQVKLLLSADASLPLCYFTEETKPSPAQAPAFVMLLRKHLQGGRILSVKQPGLERILRFEVEHLDEMGDLCTHVLVLELMGKYSNLIFLSSGEIITDSIKHISSMVSSVREVLPGRTYFIPETRNKKDPFEETEPAFLENCLRKNTGPDNAAAVLSGSYTGFSSITGEELASRAYHSALLSSGGDLPDNKRYLSELWNEFCRLITQLRAGSFRPSLYFAEKDGRMLPREYAALPLSIYKDLQEKDFDDMSSLLAFYYGEKSRMTRIHQRTSDLRHITGVLLDRDRNKYALQQKQLKDTEKRDKYRVYGELLNAYGYSIEQGAKSAELLNYYTGETMTVPLDPSLTPSQNAQRYFERYNKLKRTYEALSSLTEDTAAEINQLENIQVSLEVSADEGDLAQIREEMQQCGLLNRRKEFSGKGGARKGKVRIPESHPLHYRGRDGFDIYVGKNNIQNDYITFKMAGGSDLWFHANDMPGSHVIVKTGGAKMEDLPDSLFEDASSLAAYYSKGREQEKVEIDYLYRREVRKPGGAKPGFVVYYTNYSILASTDISRLTEVHD